MDPRSTFVKRFGDLVTLLRVDPGNDAAQELALSAAAAAVADAPLEIEAGIEWAAMPPGMALKERMLARQVDCLRVAAGAPALELQALARALAHDVTPVRSSPSIEVEQVRLLPPPAEPPEDGDPERGPRGGGAPPTDRAGFRPENRRRAGERRAGEDRRRNLRACSADSERRRDGKRRMTGERRLPLIRGLRAESARLLEALAQNRRLRMWEEVLHGACALIRLEPRLPQSERRMHGICLRRALPRPALEALVELAERDCVSREPAAEVLRWIGVEAAEAMLDRLRRDEALGVRGFLYEVIGAIPAAYPLLVPMLRSPLLHEVRHGAALLGRLRRVDAVAELAPLLDHPDELVRLAVVQALGELHEASAAEPLRRALHHPSARTRASAAAAIATWRGGALALLLAAALEDEPDRDAWHAVVEALGRIGSAHACAALATVALTRRSILRRRGYTTAQRLAAVAALGLADTKHGHLALARLARLNHGVVSSAADRVLRAEGLRAG